MPNAYFAPPPPVNEPVKSYAPGSPERSSLRARLMEMREEHVTIPAIIGGERVLTGRTVDVVAPHEHKRVLATAHLCGKDEVVQAIKAAQAASDDWRRMDWADRAAIFLKAADLLAGPMRDTLNAATMLGQSKNVYQAEIDAACELIDFLRFNVQFATELYAQQPVSSPGIWNRTDYRPLEGFVFAVTPFNFTAIQANLPAAPAMMGNVVLWKPSNTALLSAHYIMELFEAAGLPPGVINLLPGDGADVGDPVMNSEHLAGLHFTGSTGTFQHLWKTIGRNISDYRTYPRIVGETGGKDFILAHPSADAKTVATAIVRGSFEYQGQKCSAASRVYVPRSLWADIEASVGEQLGRISVGPVEDMGNFVNAVIDKKSFDNIASYIDYAKQSSDARIAFGGTYSDEVGYFVDPTVVVTENPQFKSMREEIFGPVVTIYVYEDDQWEETMTLVDETSPYALTGAVFAQQRGILAQASDRLVHAAGNFYLNDKPTGAVVGQQPFGGARASGTNDKAGSLLNLTRWTSPRSIKENFAPPNDFVYPFLAPDEGAI